MRILVTGAAGFIGSHVSEALLRDGHEVVGVDCFTDLYDRAIKERNLTDALEQPGFSFEELDLRDGDLSGVVEGIDAVVHLGGAADVSDPELNREVNVGGADAPPVATGINPSTGQWPACTCSPAFSRYTVPQ